MKKNPLVEVQFNQLISPAYLELLKKENKNGPIHRQLVPSKKELFIDKAELSDPIGDLAHSPLKGVVHRYSDRILIWPTNKCALHCRFCFRKALTGIDWKLSTLEIKKILQYIKKHHEIEEIIFSGGDPFMLANKELIFWLKEINIIKHIKRIRFHTRMFSALSNRFNKKFFTKIKFEKPINIVVHINHPAEITAEFIATVEQARRVRINIFSQTVLLKGVNDKAKTLRELFLKLLDIGVKPYYLHQADLVPGTKHFRVSYKQGIKLMQELQKSTSGLALPKYMVEIPNGPGKVPIDLRMVDH